MEFAKGETEGSLRRVDGVLSSPYYDTPAGKNAVDQPCRLRFNLDDGGVLTQPEMLLLQPSTPTREPLRPTDRLQTVERPVLPPPRFLPFGNPLCRSPDWDQGIRQRGQTGRDTTRRASGVAGERGPFVPVLGCPATRPSPAAERLADSARRHRRQRRITHALCARGSLADSLTHVGASGRTAALEQNGVLFPWHCPAPAAWSVALGNARPEQCCHLLQLPPLCAFRPSSAFAQTLRRDMTRGGARWSGVRPPRLLRALSDSAHARHRHAHSTRVPRQPVDTLSNELRRSVDASAISAPQPVLRHRFHLSNHS